MTIISYLKKKINLFAILIFLSSIAISNGKEKLSSLDFLYRIRHPAGRKTWSMLTGKMNLKRRGEPAVSTPIYLGILFSKDHTLAQVVVNKNQAYMVGQVYSTKKLSTTVIPNNPNGYKKPILGEYGIKPEDLTMSFIYWQFIKELPEESLKTLNCRVFKLVSPDKTETVHIYISSAYFFPIKVEWFKAKTEKPNRTLQISEKTLNCRVFKLVSPDKTETVHIYISSAYFFPMKVEWFKAKTEKPNRTLQVSDFTKIDDIWLITRIKFDGPGWQSVIDFNDNRAGVSQKNIPKELFKKL